MAFTAWQNLLIASSFFAVIASILMVVIFKIYQQIDSSKRETTLLKYAVFPLGALTFWCLALFVLFALINVTIAAGAGWHCMNGEGCSQFAENFVGENCCQVDEE